MKKTHIDVELLDKEETVNYLTKAGKKLPESLPFQSGPFLMVFVPEDKHRAKAFQKFTADQYRDGEGHKKFVGDAFLTELDVHVGDNESRAEFYEASEGIIRRLKDADLIDELKREALINQYRATSNPSIQDKVSKRLADEASRGYKR